MFIPRLRYPASALAGKHRLTGDDATVLRRRMFGHGLQSFDDAAQLIALNRSCPEATRDWNGWFVETIAGFVVGHVDAQGGLDDASARFLLDLWADGVISHPAELELLLHAMELAGDVPETVTVLALEQLQRALQTGSGAYARLRLAKRAGISQIDTDYLYRILRRSVQGGKVVLHPGEIAVIEAIDGLVRGESNHPAWPALVKSMAVRDKQGRVSAEHWLTLQSPAVSTRAAA